MGHNSAMAVDNCIPVTVVGETRLDIGWEEGSEELKNRHRVCGS